MPEFKLDTLQTDFNQVRADESTKAVLKKIEADIKTYEIHLGKHVELHVGRVKAYMALDKIKYDKNKQLVQQFGMLAAARLS